MSKNYFLIGLIGCIILSSCKDQDEAITAGLEYCDSLGMHKHLFLKIYIESRSKITTEKQSDMILINKFIHTVDSCNPPKWFK
jgi:hypothetical protein